MSYLGSIYIASPTVPASSELCRNNSKTAFVILNEVKDPVFAEDSSAEGLRMTLQDGLCWEGKPNCRIPVRLLSVNYLTRLSCLNLFTLQAISTRLPSGSRNARSEEHTSELQSPCNLVCCLLLEKT